MEFIIVTLLVGMFCLVGFLIYTLNENRKKRNALIQLLSKSLLELNQNKEILKQFIIYYKPNKHKIDDLEAGEEGELKKNKHLPLGLEPPVFRHDEIDQLKLSNDFIIFADIKFSIELNNVILRMKYLNRIMPDVNAVALLSTEEFKTFYHTHELVVRLIKSLEQILAKLK